MGFLANLTNQLGIMLRSQSAARRIMLFFVALFSLGLLGWLIIQAQFGSYVVLLSNLRPADGIEAMQKLHQLGISAKTDNGGATIRVPQTRFDDAIMMLSMEGIPSSGTVGYELMDKTSLGQSDFQQQKNYLRMREGELARTLLTIREISRARVSLAIPKDELYSAEEKQATASVVLKMQPGAHLNERQVTGVVNLVAHSIEGLKPANVSIVDDMGNTLNQAHNDDVTQSTLAQQSYKTQYEETLKTRLESMLENVVGKGKVSARVQAEFNFATQHQIRQTYNPDDQTQIVKMDKTTMESSSKAGAGMAAEGTPGSSSNLLLATGNAVTSSPGLSRSDRTTEYAVSSMWNETQQAVPDIKRVSVAVLVDEAEEKDAAGKVSYRTRTPIEISSLEDLVKAAIGFTQNDQREDQIKVLCERFHTDSPETVKESLLNSYPMRQYIQLGVQWGIVGLIGLLLILMVLRPAIKQITVIPANGGMLPAGAGGGMAALNPPSGLGGQMLSGETLSHIAGKNAELTEEEILADDFDLNELPEELRDNTEAIRQYKLQRLAAKKARLTQAEAQKIHKEVVDTARTNPQKTVSLMRQWMDEA